MPPPARRRRTGRHGHAIGRALPELRPPESRYVRWIKPTVDRLVALLLLLLLLPLFAVVALVVWATLGRPLLYHQRRVGRGGGHFVLWKFRTMQPDRRRRDAPVDVERRVCHKRVDDPRHTRCGRVLRRTSLDELPQLVNVLAGHMSIVGPRPELVEIVDHYQPWQHFRHAVKPGLTGLWQVSRRGNGLMHENTDIDLEYLRRISFRTDVEIMLRTPPALVRGGG